MHVESHFDASDLHCPVDPPFENNLASSFGNHLRSMEMLQPSGMTMMIWW